MAKRHGYVFCHTLGELAGKLEELGNENRLEEAEKLLDFLEMAAFQTIFVIARSDSDAAISFLLPKG